MDGWQSTGETRNHRNHFCSVEQRHRRTVSFLHAASHRQPLGTTSIVAANGAAEHSSRRTFLASKLITDVVKPRDQGRSHGRPVSYCLPYTVSAASLADCVQCDCCFDVVNAAKSALDAPHPNPSGRLGRGALVNRNGCYCYDWRGGQQ